MWYGAAARKTQSRTCSRGILNAVRSLRTHVHLFFFFRKDLCYLVEVAYRSR